MHGTVWKRGAGANFGRNEKENREKAEVFVIEFETITLALTSVDL